MNNLALTQYPEWIAAPLQRILGQQNLEPQPLYVGLLSDVAFFDLPNIYHHLHCGTPLDIKVEEAGSEYERLAVYYRSFKLGYIWLNEHPIIRELTRNGLQVSVRVRHVVHRKYMPAEAVSIELFSQKSTKKVHRK